MPDYDAGIRFAIERGDFARAGELWKQWVAELSRRPDDRSEWARLRETYQWSRNHLLADRAHLSDRLNKLRVAGAYQAAMQAAACSQVPKGALAADEHR